MQELVLIDFFRRTDIFYLLLIFYIHTRYFGKHRTHRNQYLLKHLIFTLYSFSSAMSSSVSSNFFSKKDDPLFLFICLIRMISEFFSLVLNLASFFFSKKAQNWEIQNLMPTLSSRKPRFEPFFLTGFAIWRKSRFGGKHRAYRKYFHGCGTDSNNRRLAGLLFETEIKVNGPVQAEICFPPF